MKISSRLSSVRVSPTLEINTEAMKLRASGEDVISLAAGEPDFETPENICQAAKLAIDRGETRYSYGEGLVELREAVIQKFKSDNQLDYSLDQIIICTGGKQVIFNAMMASLDAGDEVIIPAPYWVSYPDIVKLFGGNPVTIKTTAADGFLITAKSLSNAITPETRWLILNSPSNPTGAVYSKEALRELGEVLIEHPQVMILSDDIYESIIFDSQPFETIASVCPELYDRVLTMNGVSKAYSMTGWRIGYGAGPSELIAAMKKVQGQSTLHPSTISQWAAIEALTCSQSKLTDNASIFNQRKGNVISRLSQAAGIRCFEPKGAFYLFAEINDYLGTRSPSGKVLETDHDWVMELLKTQGVAVVPGSAFGAAGFFRLSFAASEDTLNDACERILRFTESLT